MEAGPSCCPFLEIDLWSQAGDNFRHCFDQTVNAPEILLNRAFEVQSEFQKPGWSAQPNFVVLALALVVDLN